MAGARGREVEWVHNQCPGSAPIGNAEGERRTLSLRRDIPSFTDESISGQTASNLIRVEMSLQWQTTGLGSLQRTNYEDQGAPRPHPPASCISTSQGCYSSHLPSSSHPWLVISHFLMPTAPDAARNTTGRLGLLHWQAFSLLPLLRLPHSLNIAVNRHVRPQARRRSHPRERQGPCATTCCPSRVQPASTLRQYRLDWLLVDFASRHRQLDQCWAGYRFQHQRRRPAPGRAVQLRGSCLPHLHRGDGMPTTESRTVMLC